MGCTCFQKLKIYSSGYFQAEKAQRIIMNFFLHAKKVEWMREHVIVFQVQKKAPKNMNSIFCALQNLKNVYLILKIYFLNKNV